MELIEGWDTKAPMDNSGYARKYLDVRYADRNDDELMDIYLPETGEGPFPVVLSIHGGGWYYGCKSSFKLKPVLDEGLKRNFAVISMQYTLSVHGTFPLSVYDIKAAVRFIKANAEKYHFDPARIALWGLSAGAHLAALAVTSDASHQLEDLSLGNADYSSSVNCVAYLYGCTDLAETEHLLAQYGKPVNDDLHDLVTPAAMFLGAAPIDVPELVRQANPETYIDENCPPFIIQHGLNDGICPFQQSIMLADKLEKAIGKDKVQVDLFPGFDHAVEGFRTKENTARIYDFIQKQFE